MFGDLDLDRAAVRHRVARVDREVEDRKLELVGVDPRRRQPFRNIQPQRDARPERALEQIAHALDQRAQIDRHRAQILLARERQQPLRQRGAALGALQRAVDQPMQPRIVGHALAQQIEIAHHRHQQIVEIMRDAAGELADRFHLLRLPQLLLGLFARGDFLHQIGGALLDALLQVAVNSASAVRSAANCSSKFSRSISAVLRAVMSEQTPTSDLMLPSGRRTARARTSTQCCEPSGQILRYSML